ncbi:unnamed protein product [Mytilus edulis]|uniref:Ankyrin repeat protein n=1 Tax=Mytilus edulis TaxID=6550 RepID=A0A8S3PZX3_MYTED|nr:unnamed protein product [Mytilus edulis]
MNANEINPVYRDDYFTFFEEEDVDFRRPAYYDFKYCQILLDNTNLMEEYINRIFVDMTSSDDVRNYIIQCRNSRNEEFNDKLLELMRRIKSEEIEELIQNASCSLCRNATSVFSQLPVSQFTELIKTASIETFHQMIMVDVQTELEEDYDGQKKILEEKRIRVVSRVLDDMKQFNKVPENRNSENKKFRDTINDNILSMSEDTLTSLIHAASSKCISNMFLSKDGHLTDDMPSFTFSENKNSGFCLLTASFKNDNIIDNLHQYPTTHLLDQFLKAKQLNSVMIQDWKDGKVHDVLGNVNLSNQSFQCEFIKYLKKIDNAEQTNLANTTDIDTGDSPLAVCCYIGILKLAEWCLEYNSITDSTNFYEEHPLYLACRHVHPDIVLCLLNSEKKADVNKKTGQTGITPLFEACERGLKTIVLHLLKEEVCVNDLVNEETPLFVACKYGHIDVVRFLLEKRGNILHINKGYQHRLCNVTMTPLYIACKGGYTEIVSLLLNHTADEVDVNKQTYEGETPLYAACEGGYRDIVSLLSKHKSLGLNKIRNDGSTSLFVASRKGHGEVVSTLLNQKDIKIDKFVVSGMSPLFIASLLGHTEIVKLLLNRNADSNICVHNKKTIEKCVDHDRHWSHKVLNLKTFITNLKENDSSSVSDLVKLQIQGMVEVRVSNMILGHHPYT